MDNKITKKRLNEFFSYEWLAMLALVVVGILAWSFVFSFASVKPTTGQSFKYFVDYDLAIGNEDGFLDALHEYDALSYDILEISGEKLDAQYDVLYTRLATHDGDVIFTSNAQPAEENGTYRAKSLIDSYGASDFDNLYKDAANYLAMFLKAEYTAEFLSLSADGDYSTVHDYSKLDESKIDDYFLTRMKGDNRFRTDAQKEEGKIKERNRIKTLCSHVADLYAIFEWDDAQAESDKVFVKYTRYSQAKEAAEGDSDALDTIQGWIDSEANSGRGNVRYMFNLGALKAVDGKTEAAEYFKLSGSANADGVVMLAFNFKREQPDHHYEPIGLVVSLVKQCSDILG